MSLLKGRRKEYQALSMHLKPRWGCMAALSASLGHATMERRVHEKKQRTYGYI